MSIKNIKPQQTDKIKTNSIFSIPYTLDHPIFCLKYLCKNYHLDKCTKDEKAALIDTFYILSQMSWNEIHMAPRHGLGTEKIERCQINSSTNNIPKDVDLFALRFLGKRPFVGYKTMNIFHVVFIDRDFTLYQH